MNDPKRKASTYIVLAIILLFVLILIYYALTAGNTKQLSVVIKNWSLTSASNSFYPINFLNITDVFNSSNNQLYFLVKLKNGGSSEVDYTSGCISSLCGIVYPTDIANLSNEKNVVSCNTITIASLLPNQTATVQWPVQPQVVEVLKTGNFNVNLTFPFKVYNATPIHCPKINLSCPANFYFSNFTKNATIQVSVS